MEKHLPDIFPLVAQKILNHIELKRYLLSQKKVNSGRIVTAELPFPLFTKAIIENKQLKSFEMKIGFS